MIPIQPIGQVELDIISFLHERMSSIWPMVLLPETGLPSGAYDQNRRQYIGSRLLDALPLSEDAILGVTEVDIFEDDLNFVFGLAIGRRALISLRRLRPESYGQQEDDELLKLRALKEAVHEIGHVFGLDHCADKACVMYFSNSILDTDLKDWRVCGLCEWQLGAWQR